MIYKSDSKPCVLAFPAQVEASFDWYDVTREDRARYAADYLALFGSALRSVVEEVRAGVEGATQCEPECGTAVLVQDAGAQLSLVCGYCV